MRGLDGQDLADVGVGSMWVAFQVALRLLQKGADRRSLVELEIPVVLLLLSDIIFQQIRILNYQLKQITD